MIRFAAGSLAVLASVIISFASPQSADAEVTRVVLSASPAEFWGNCPGEITFTGTIMVNAPGATALLTRLQRHWSLTKEVTVTWTLGGQELPFYEGWEAIKVTAPNEFVSNRAAFS